MSTSPVSTPLAERGVLEVAGDDRVSFLQGLVTNDVAKADGGHALYAALLTAQGRFLHDFFIVALGDALYLDTESHRLDELRRRLAPYRLRAKVTLAPASDRFAVWAGFGTGAADALGLSATPGAAREIAGGAAYVDPRNAALGVRLLLPRGAAMPAGFALAESGDYERLRLSLGVPDGSRDLPPERALPMESGFDELNGIDWQKGCYIGQELTARMKHRALVKKRLMKVAVEGALPPPGTEVTFAGAEAGELRSGGDGVALALLRIEAVEKAKSQGAPLLAGDARLTPGD